MTGDLNGLTVSLSSFWAPPKSGPPRRDADPNAATVGATENSWDELVDWFEQQHEWLLLVSSFENAHV
jgi:hypothetical protein